MKGRCRRQETVKEKQGNAAYGLFSSLLRANRTSPAPVELLIRLQTLPGPEGVGEGESRREENKKKGEWEGENGAEGKRGKRAEWEGGKGVTWEGEVWWGDWRGSFGTRVAVYERCEGKKLIIIIIIS